MKIFNLHEIKKKLFVWQFMLDDPKNWMDDNIGMENAIFFI